MHIKSEKAKKTTKHTLYSTLELTENNQRSINKAQKVMTIHIITLLSNKKGQFDL